MNLRLLLPVACVLPLLAAWAFSGEEGPGSFEQARQQIALRKIGHELLLHAGDTTSRVLPVLQVSGNEYRLQFERPFTFAPDSLVQIIRRNLQESGLSQRYIVNVIECAHRQTVYGFSINQDRQDNMIPCTGRQLPAQCYTIALLFPERGRPGQSKNLLFLLSGLMTAPLFLAVSRFSARRRGQSRVPVRDTDNADNNDNSIAIGLYRFYPEAQLLLLGDERTSLTAKEARLLSIFAAELNQLIDRQRLLKEGWEDEGVITGRSLDMFVSKLRRKLQGDPSIRFTNIHGRGYRLEVSGWHAG